MDTPEFAHAFLEEGDFVVALGITITNQSAEQYHRVLARVVGVGEKDVFAVTEDSGRLFQIPAERCTKLKMRKNTAPSTLLYPRIGDLVLSIQARYGSTREKTMGLLVETIDIPGKIKLAKLLKGEETETVPFASLIVVESAVKRE